MMQRSISLDLIWIRTIPHGYGKILANHNRSSIEESPLHPIFITIISVCFLCLLLITYIPVVSLLHPSPKSSPSLDRHRSFYILLKQPFYSWEARGFYIWKPPFASVTTGCLVPGFHCCRPNQEGSPRVGRWLFYLFSTKFSRFASKPPNKCHFFFIQTPYIFLTCCPAKYGDGSKLATSIIRWLIQNINPFQCVVPGLQFWPIPIWKRRVNSLVNYICPHIPYVYI